MVDLQAYVYFGTPNKVLESCFLLFSIICFLLFIFPYFSMYAAKLSPGTLEKKGHNNYIDVFHIVKLKRRQII